MDETLLKSDDELGTYLKGKGRVQAVDEVIGIIEDMGRPEEKEEENETEEN